MPDDKMTEKEKAALQESLREASLSDRDIRLMVQGETETGEPISTDEAEDIVLAASSALEFVEGLEAPEPKAEIRGADAVAGFDALLQKLETLRSDISSLQRGVVGVFASQLLAFRGRVIEIKSSISEEMVEKLKMPMMKGFIETSFAEVVDQEFGALEKELVDKIVEQTQERFKEFASRVRESEVDLRSTIVEQQDVVRSFMESLEEDSASIRQEVKEKENEIKRLEKEIEKLHARIDMEAASETSKEELSRKVGELEAHAAKLEQELERKDTVIETREEEIKSAKEETAEVQMKLGEVLSQLEVYKTEREMETPAGSKTDAEYEALQEKVELLENKLGEKREEADKIAATAKELEMKLDEAVKEQKAAEEEAKNRLDELESMQNRIMEVKELEEEVYELKQSLAEQEKEMHVLEMQATAFEKATRLIEKERDMALQERDLAKERTRRYIQVLGKEANTKVLLLVDEVGSISFADLGKALGVPAGLAAKYARELEKQGVLKIENEKAISTLEDLDIEEGEVKVD